MREALAASREALGDRHPDTLVCLQRLEECLMSAQGSKAGAGKDGSEGCVLS